jgi:hypothetical protein
MGLLTCFYIKNLNLYVCLRIFLFSFLDSILNITKAQFHGLSLVPIQTKKIHFFEIYGVLINKVSQGSPKKTKSTFSL